MTAAVSDTLHLRPFTGTDADYAAWCAVHNAVYPEYPETPDEMRFHDDRREAKIKWGRLIAERDGAVVGVGGYGQDSGSYDPRRFHLDVYVSPAHRGRGVGAALYERLLAEIAPHDPAVLRTWIREDHAGGLRFATARGFVEDMREQESLLDLSGFDPARFAAEVEKVTAQGIVLRTVAELRDSDPEYRVKLYDLGWALAQDIPHTDELTRPTFERWCQRFDNPNFLWDGNVVAVNPAAGDRYIGTSTLWAAQGTDDLATGTTGVLREYRKRGIATALKVRALAWAKKRGTPAVRTENEVNNDGMLGINFRLGFVR